MDSYTTGIVIRSQIQERHEVAAQERLIRAARVSTPAGPTWRERLAVIAQRPVAAPGLKGR